MTFTYTKRYVKNGGFGRASGYELLNSGFARDVEAHGILPWSPLTDYEFIDNELHMCTFNRVVYTSVQPSGPSSIVGPIQPGTNAAYWSPLEGSGPGTIPIATLSDILSRIPGKVIDAAQFASPATAHIYWDVEAGNDTNDGTTQTTAVQTAARVRELNVIYNALGSQIHLHMGSSAASVLSDYGNVRVNNIEPGYYSTIDGHAVTISISKGVRLGFLFTYSATVRIIVEADLDGVASRIQNGLRTHESYLVISGSGAGASVFKTESTSNFVSSEVLVDNTITDFDMSACNVHHCYLSIYAVNMSILTSFYLRSCVFMLYSRQITVGTTLDCRSGVVVFGDSANTVSLLSVGGQLRFHGCKVVSTNLDKIVVTGGILSSFTGWDSAGDISAASLTLNPGSELITSNTSTLSQMMFTGAVNVHSSALQFSNTKYFNCQAVNLYQSRFAMTGSPSTVQSVMNVSATFTAYNSYVDLSSVTSHGVVGNCSYYNCHVIGLNLAAAEFNCAALNIYDTLYTHRAGRIVGTGTFTLNGGSFTYTAVSVASAPDRSWSNPDMKFNAMNLGYGKFNIVSASINRPVRIVTDSIELNAAMGPMPATPLQIMYQTTGGIGITTVVHPIATVQTLPTS